MAVSKRSFFYKKLSVTATVLPDDAQVKFGFDATRVIICNDGAGPNADAFLTWSFLKPNVDGELFCADGPIAFDGVSEGRLWLMSSGAPIQVRIWAWRI